MFHKNKKGLMDDFFDLVFMVTALFFMFFFVLLFFKTDTNAKTETTLAKIEAFHTDENLLQYLNYPVSVKGKEVRMKEVILHAAASGDQKLFREKTQEFIQQRNFEGMVQVFETDSYKSGGLPLFSHSNTAFGSGERSEAELKDKNFGSITVVMLG